MRVGLLRTTAFTALFLGSTLVSSCRDEEPTGLDKALCARLSACDRNDEKLGIKSACNLLMMHENYPYNQTILQRVLRAQGLCVARATNCAELETCLSGTPEQQSVCATGGDIFHCVEGGSVVCGFGQVTEFYDCVAAGLMCDEQAGVIFCEEAECDQASFQPRCEGTELVSCKPQCGVDRQDCNIYWGTECDGVNPCRPIAGETCGETSPGEVGCVGAGPPCDPLTFTARCEGDVLVTCNHGREGRVDCRRYHDRYTCEDASHCDLDDDEDECTASTEPICFNGLVTYCLEGQVAWLDCTDYGFAGCATGDSQFGTVAYCTDEPDLP